MKKIVNYNYKQCSYFIAFPNYYSIQIKIAECAINLFYVSSTPNMKFYNAIFTYLKNFRFLVLFLKF